MNDSAKSKVREQFSKNADKYVASPLHAAGEDLACLVSSSGAEKNMDVLDIATGGGHVANALAPLVRRVTALDLTRDILQSARRFIQGNGHDASIIDGCRLSKAAVLRYRHSDMDDLRGKAREAGNSGKYGKIMVITDEKVERELKLIG